MTGGAHGIGMTSRRTRDRLIARLQEQGIEHAAVLDAIARVPRHLFVDEALASRAYEDTALPIGFGQTISQPYVVALMTSIILRDTVPQRVLEIGTGCGYQTAVLSSLVGRVYTVERIQALLTGAKKRLVGMKLRNISFRLDDGALGWPEQAPFDAILAAAAPDAVPEALKNQLTPGGRLVLPVGTDTMQQLLCITRTPEGFEEEVLGTARFVPLVPGGTRKGRRPG